MSRGRRESQWLVICRCLAIIYQAQRGPASREELIQAVLLQEGPAAWPCCFCWSGRKDRQI